jgi:hypothetical protein
MSVRRSAVLLHLIAASAFVTTAAIRLMAASFPNDHFLYLAAAQQMLFGQWPSRDFVDPGTPLMYAASALAQSVVGPPLLAEAWLVASMFGAAAALTVYASYAASGSLVAATVAAAVQMALFPRTYHYPKLILCAVGALLLWRYVDRPSRRRLAVLSGGVAIAFLFRHDLGVYLGAAGLVAVAGARPGWGMASRRIGQYVGLVAALLAPYFIALTLTTGLTRHVEGGLAYSRVEAERTTLPLQVFDVDRWLSRDNAFVWLFYAYHLLPVVALVVASRRADRSGQGPSDLARVLPLALLALAINVALLRDPLQARLPDVAAPAGVLGAWLATRLWREPHARRAGVRAAIVLLLIPTLAAVNAVGRPLEQLDRAGLLTPVGRWRSMLDERLTELRTATSPEQLPSRTAAGLLPFLEYVQRCTRPDDYLFVAGESPELYVLAGRAFAGGQQALRAGYFSSTADQEQLVRRLAGQRVPVAIILMNSDAEADFPLVIERLTAAFRHVADIEPHEEQRVRVLVRNDLTPSSVDPGTGFPCFR